MRIAVLVCVALLSTACSGTSQDGADATTSAPAAASGTGTDSAAPTPSPTPSTRQAFTPSATSTGAASIEPTPTTQTVEVAWQLTQTNQRRVARPSLSRAPELRRQAAVIRTDGRWKSLLTVPSELATDHITCEFNRSASYRYDSWTFTAASDPDYDSEYALDDEGAWFQIEVTDSGRDGTYEAEAILSVSDGDLFTITDSTGNADNVNAPVLQWSWNDSKRLIRFAYKTASYPEFSFDRSDGIGNVLVAGTIRCP